MTSGRLSRSSTTLFIQLLRDLLYVMTAVLPPKSSAEPLRWRARWSAMVVLPQPALPITTVWPWEGR